MIYTDEDVEKIIMRTVDATVLKLKMTNLLVSERKSAYRKTEELLRNYKTFKNVRGQPYTEKLVCKIDEAMEDIKDDIYYELVPLFYFENATKESLADKYNVTVRTITRQKGNLVNKLKTRLFSDDVIQELFM